MQIEGKTVLVTGGAVRIGHSIAKKLAKNGAKLAIHYNSSETNAIESLQEMIPFAKDLALFRADLNDTTETVNLIRAVEERLGTIDILVNNASIFEMRPFLEVSEQDWDRHMNINLKAPFLLSQGVAKGMLSKKAGKIINITDYTAVRPSKDYLPYNISKAGLTALTKSLAKELAPYIQVNGIALGPTLAPENYTAEKKKQVAEKTLLKRWGNPEDVANAVLFFLEGTEYATGQTLYIDGGKLLV